jgi:chemotaxis protein MotB
MSSATRRRRPPAAGHESNERWLLTYADMITLLLALFVVLFSISSVNISKYRTLQAALRNAFGGHVLPGGGSILNPAQQATASGAGRSVSESQPAVPSIVPNAITSPSTLVNRSLTSSSQAMAQAAATVAAQTAAQIGQIESFKRLKRLLLAYARSHGFAKDVIVSIQRRGLVVRVLTDNILFDSGHAELKPEGLPLIDEVARLINVDHTHPVVVEGYTDNQPIHTAQFPSNWELATTRADAVLHRVVGDGVDVTRMSAAGFADLRPVASDATAIGRAQNRRVEIVLQRLGSY